jgi:Rps23 Pro-64 3,4-dihydroxylase Tpa1-like proline 4-hydroxylase
MTVLKVIRPDVLGARRSELLAQWHSAAPFPLVVIDNFANDAVLNRITKQFPDPDSLNKSRDFIFAKNKFEKNGFSALSSEMSDLYDDLVSSEFSAFLSEMCGTKLFVDPAFHGGGLHMGGAGSFLDMHADFNVHPLHEDWLRELNILLYLNEGWHPDWGGQLKLRHKETGATREVEPLFNRAVIMLTKDHTLHGYDPLQFPEGRYRKSIATYAYSLIPQGEHIVPRTTVWESDQSMFRRMIGPMIPTLIRIKSRFLGSGSARNQ